MMGTQLDGNWEVVMIKIDAIKKDQDEMKRNMVTKLEMEGVQKDLKGMVKLVEANIEHNEKATRNELKGLKGEVKTIKGWILGAASTILLMVLAAIVGLVLK